MKPNIKKNSMIYQKGVAMCHIMKHVPVKMNDKKTLKSHTNQALTKKCYSILKPLQAKRCIIPEVDQYKCQPNSKYICLTSKAPKMNWSVDDGLYNSFIKWKIRCENILDCELAMLSETRKYKKVIAWSGDFGLDQYISWNLSNEELCLDTIWQKYERVL